MSEQSPWGTPPPSSPSGPPSYQPPQQPPGGGWSGPPYGGPSGPGGPPPPKRRTGLILGIVAAVLVVIAAFTVTLLVATNGDDPDESATDDPSSETTSETSTETTTESSDPTETTSDPPPEPGDGTIIGNGYQFDLPAVGWSDATAEKDKLGPGSATIDSIIILGSSVEQAQSNILVEALSSGAAASVEDLEGQWKRNLSSSDGATPVDIDDITLDGETAIGVRIDDRVNVNGLPIKQVAYLALHEGQQFSIGLSYPAEGDAVSEPDFQKVLESWAWTS